MKRKKRRPQNRDRNKELAHILGSVARMNSRPSTACPNLIPVFGEAYGAELCDAWMRGWNDQDRTELMQSRRAMKGAD